MTPSSSFASNIAVLNSDKLEYLHKSSHEESALGSSRIIKDLLLSSFQRYMLGSGSAADVKAHDDLVSALTNLLVTL